MDFAAELLATEPRFVQRARRSAVKRLAQEREYAEHGESLESEDYPASRAAANRGEDIHIGLERRLVHHEAGRRDAVKIFVHYSTVTDLARLRGLSHIEHSANPLLTEICATSNRCLILRIVISSTIASIRCKACGQKLTDERYPETGVLVYPRRGQTFRYYSSKAVIGGRIATEKNRIPTFFLMVC
jgi:hypothetical protein